MSINFENLDATTRQHMLEEIDLDIRSDHVYYSRFLKDTAKDEWNYLLTDAVRSHDDSWLEHEIQSNHILVSTYPKRTPKGNTTIAKVPYTASATLAEGEFNRFYCRGLCLTAIEEHTQVQVYRGKQVQNPRAESEQLIDNILDPNKLLIDLREHIGVDTALGVPNGPNSGLTIRLL